MALVKDGVTAIIWLFIVVNRDFGIMIEQEEEIVADVFWNLG